MSSRIALIVTAALLALSVWQVVAQDSPSKTVENQATEERLPRFFLELDLDKKQREKLNDIHKSQQQYIRTRVAQIEEYLRGEKSSEFEKILTPDQKKRLQEIRDKDYAETVEREPALKPNPRLQPLEEAIRKVVVKHYPEAKVKREGSTISFEWNTRTFLIHTRGHNTGKWQSPWTEMGPQGGDERMGGLRSGICGEVEFIPGMYGGMAEAQTFDRHYYQDQFMIPHSDKLGAFLDVRLKYPDDVPPEFLEEFRGLMHKFDEHVAAVPK